MNESLQRPTTTKTSDLNLIEALCQDNEISQIYLINYKQWKHTF